MDIPGMNMREVLLNPETITKELVKKMGIKVTST